MDDLRRLLIEHDKISTAQPRPIDFVNNDNEQPKVLLAIRMLRVQTEFMDRRARLAGPSTTFS
jgi:hypothetical protein